MKYFILGILISIFGCMEAPTTIIEEYYPVDTLYVRDTVFVRQTYPYNLGKLLSIYPFPTDSEYKLQLNFLKDTVYVWYPDAQTYGKEEFSNGALWIMDPKCIYTQSKEGCLKYWKE